jgi:hypothetical protein
MEYINTNNVIVTAQGVPKQSRMMQCTLDNFLNMCSWMKLVSHNHVHFLELYLKYEILMNEYMNTMHAVDNGYRTTRIKEISIMEVKFQVYMGLVYTS